MTDASSADVWEFSQHITRALASAFDPASRRVQHIFDNGVFAVYAGGSGIELRFSEANEKPRPEALIAMAVALAKLRDTPIELCDERPKQHIGASVTVHPWQGVHEVRACYEKEVNAYSGFSLTFDAQVNALVEALSILPGCSIEADEGAPDETRLYRICFTRAHPPAVMADMARRIMQLCNRADEGTDARTAKLIEALGEDASHLRTGRVVAGVADHDGRELLVSVPANFTFSHSALDILCDAARGHQR